MSSNSPGERLMSLLMGLCLFFLAMVLWSDHPIWAILAGLVGIAAFHEGFKSDADPADSARPNPFAKPQTISQRAQGAGQAPTRYGTGRLLELEYSDADGVITRRTITVKNRRRYDGTVLLRGWCHLRNEERTFRADRMLEARDPVSGEVVTRDFERWLTQYPTWSL